MPTAITHGIVGLAANWAFAPRETPKYFWGLATACSILPDLDILGFYIGLPHRHLFAHRGFFHSPFFALLLSLLVLGLLFRRYRIFSKPWFSYFFFFFFVTTSHGLLDALNSGGYGAALFIPFNDSRYSFPWTPLPIPPIRIRSFFSPWGWTVFKRELLWVWLPLLFLVLISRSFRSAFAGRENRRTGL